MKKAVEQTVEHFGGLDMLVSNAGIFPKSAPIAQMDGKDWQKSMDINVTSHQQLMHLSLPFLELGFDPAIVLVGSKMCPLQALVLRLIPLPKQVLHNWAGLQHWNWAAKEYV